MENWQKDLLENLENAQNDFDEFWQEISINIENIAEDLTQEVENFAEEIEDNFNQEFDDFLQTIDDFNDEFLKLLWEIFEPFNDDDENNEEESSSSSEISPLNDEEENNEQSSSRNIFYNNFIDDDMDFLNPKIHPNAEKYPACIGCSNYHGHVYNGNILVCGIHPHGWDDDNCPDWEE